MEGGACRGNKIRRESNGGRSKKLKAAVGIELKDELDCGKCREEDCFMCPRIFISKKSQYYLMLYGHYKSKYLLRAGGIADQPQEYLQAMAIIKTEINKLRFTDDGGAKGSGKQNRNQGIGEYCKGRALEECKKYFGEGMLVSVCKTCPD